MGLFVIDTLLFTIDFTRFPGNSTEVKLKPGLHVIYGESGVGKSNLVQHLSGTHGKYPGNFDVEIQKCPNPIQIVLQNPDSQIICDTVDGELAFSLECNQTDSAAIQSAFLALKKELPFSVNGSRHPVTLSGGEKEILNIITAFSTEPELIILDDCLSFLNHGMKNFILENIQQKLFKNNQIVLWLTSDIDDLEYGVTHWELSLSALSQFNLGEKPMYPCCKLKKGSLNLEIDSMFFAYRDERILFKQMSCTVNNSRSLGIVGANGSGKTTLASLMIGINHPDSGVIKLKLEGGIAPTIAYLDQFPERLIGEKTLEDLLQEFLRIGKLQVHLHKKCITVMERTQIKWDLIRNKSSYDIPWSILRIALIVILTHCEFDLLILDEPTFGLGWEQKVNLLQYLQRYLKQKHLIVISHDVEFVNTICDTVLSLDNDSITTSDLKRIEREDT